MIDWLTMCAQLTHSERLLSGRMIIITPEGEVKFERDQALQVEGSHDSRVMIWSHPDPFGDHGRYVRVSGCPSKFLQGHNVFGSNDLHGIAIAMLERICTVIGTEPTELDRADWRRGNIGLTMVDVTESWELSSRDQVRSALQALSEFARLKNRGGAVVRGGTNYWGQHSRRWALKCYGKGDELEAKKRGHKLPYDLPMRDEVTAYADRLLRFELRLLSLELRKQDAHVAKSWVPGFAQVLHSNAMDKLEISEAAMLKPDKLEGLPPRLALAYQSWQSGHDLRAMLSRATFYRYRAELLKHGVDIALRRPHAPESNVVPLRVVLHARPVSVPAWAHNTPLYFEPKRA
jgi:II/X family phage/plasmid replication protein